METHNENVMCNFTVFLIRLYDYLEGHIYIFYMATHYENVMCNFTVFLLDCMI